MKHPWQVWLAFVFCLTITVPALGWFTWQALDLERMQLRAAAESRLEQDVQEAVWQLDAFIAPLLAEEAARPYYVYQPYYPAPGEPSGKGKLPQAPARVRSPLLTPPSEFVVLHFQIGPDGALTSPQCPDTAASTWAVDNGASLASITQCAQKKDLLADSLCSAQLAEHLPKQMLPPPEQLAFNTFNLAQGPQDSNGNSASFISNDVALNKIRQQFDQENGEPTAQLPVEDPVDPNQSDEKQQVAAVPQQANLPQLRQGNSADQQAQNRANQRKVQRNYDTRSQALQQLAQGERVKQRVDPALPAPQSTAVVSEGVSVPIWIGEKLLLARRTIIGRETLVQGCWLDWPRLQTAFRERVAESLPSVDFAPVTDKSSVVPSRTLANLPVQLVVPSPELTIPWNSAQRVALGVAWACLAAGAAAVAILLAGVVRLSENRAAFVSSVTHELRTPLTTFRMYTEMLSQGMVADPAQQQAYLQTLKVEADRLSHLVSNVLSYARLERGRKGGRRETIALGDLVDRMAARLGERAALAEMELVIEAESAARQTLLGTDPAAVEQIVFNLVDNACKYAASASDRRLHLSLCAAPGGAKLRVTDHGPGVAPAVLRQLFAPFSKTAEAAARSAPGIGLGLALCRRLARDLGGKLDLDRGHKSGAAFELFLPAPQATPHSDA